MRLEQLQCKCGFFRGHLAKYHDVGIILYSVISSLQQTKTKFKEMAL